MIHLDVGSQFRKPLVILNLIHIASCLDDVQDFRILSFFIIIPFQPTFNLPTIYQNQKLWPYGVCVFRAE